MKTIKHSKGQRIRIPAAATRNSALRVRGSWLNAKSMPEPQISKSKSRVTKRVKPRPKHAPINWQTIERRCWLFLGMVFTLSVWLSPVTQPASLQIRGVPIEGQAELKAILESRWLNPFAMNTGYNALQDALTQINWVQDAQFTPELSGSMTGIIVPRRAAAKIITSNNAFWLDENGYAFIPPNPKEHRQAKTIRLQYLPSVQLGKPIEDEALKRSLDCLEKIRMNNLPQKVVFDINLEREICLNIIGLSTGRALQVRLGDASDIAEQFQALTQLFRQKPRLLAQCEYLDLQCPSAPAVKRRDTSRRSPDSSTGGKKP